MWLPFSKSFRKSLTKFFNKQRNFCRIWNDMNLKYFFANVVRFTSTLQKSFTLRVENVCYVFYVNINGETLKFTHKTHFIYLALILIEPTSIHMTIFNDLFYCLLLRPQCNLISKFIFCNRMVVYVNMWMSTLFSVFSIPTKKECCWNWSGLSIAFVGLIFK